MGNYARPQFWLQVRKDYILDNFENLLQYLRNYQYAEEEEHPDYDATLESMVELCSDFGALIRKTPIYEKPELGVDVLIVTRMLCATILAAYKRRETRHDVICVLIELITKTQRNIDEEVLKDYARIIKECIVGKKLSDTGFGWGDIADGSTHLAILIRKVSQIRFQSSKHPDELYYRDNKGLLLCPSTDALPEIAVMNLNQYQRGEQRDQYSIPGFMRLLTTEKNYEKVTDFEQCYKLTSRLISEQETIRPSQLRKLKRYEGEDKFLVQITSVMGTHITAKTIDSAYELIEGRVDMSSVPARPDMYTFCQSVRVGDYMYVFLNEDKNKLGYAFELFAGFEEFYRDFASEFADKRALAIYQGDYPMGTSWVTEDGIRIGIGKDRYEELSDENKQIFNDCVENGRPMPVKFFAKPPKMDAEKFNVYAKPELKDYFAVKKEDMFTSSDCDTALIEEFLDFCADEASAMNISTKVYMPIDHDMGEVYISLMHRLVEDNDYVTLERLKIYSLIAMLCKMYTHPMEYEYIEHARRYLLAQVRFASKGDMTELTHDNSLQDVPEILARENVINVLRKYKHKSMSAKGVQGYVDEKAVQHKIEALVEASNNLLDILDDNGLDNIKMAIARTMGVEDEYISISDDRTYYGTESLTREFKASAVFPPSNRRRMASLVYDPEQQKWAILKAVCGFLNSRSGGELLLGVNDTGYANGLKDDINELCRHGVIKLAELDRYNIYISNMLDMAFKVEGQDVASADLARGCIESVPETNAEGYDVVRIKVRPYQTGVVELAAPAAERPEGIDSAYVRVSGRTVPLTPVVRHNMMKYKKIGK